MNEIKKAIISKFGGVKMVANICGITSGAVSQWVEIPPRHQRKLLEAAPSRKIKLTPYDFFEVTGKP